MEDPDYKVILSPGIRLWVESKTAGKQGQEVVLWEAARSGRGPAFSGGKITGEEEEVCGSGFCWVASHCVILSTLLLTYRIRELDQGMAQSLLSRVS